MALNWIAETLPNCLFGRLACAALFLVPGPAALAQEQKTEPLTADILFRGANVLDGTGGRFVGDVHIRDGRIVATGQNLAIDEAEVRDASGLWITPGIIDVHTHYGTFLMPYNAGQGEVSDVTEQSGPDVSDTWIEHGVRPVDPAFSRALAAGVTTVQVLPGSNTLLSGRAVVLHPVPAAIVERIRVENAPRGLKLACGSNPASRSVDDNRFPSSRQGQIAFLRAALSKARALNKQGLNPTLVPSDQNDLTPDEAKAAALIAAMAGKVPVHIHCYRAEDIANWVELLNEFGISDITVHHASESYKIADLLARRGACAAVWSDWWGFKREAEDAIPEAAAIIDAAGGCAIMHSDIPVLGTLLNMEAAKAAAAGRRAGLDIGPERAITWITHNAARSLGIADRTGSLKPGFDADVVVWSGDPMSVYSKPLEVYIGGVLQYDADKASPPTDFELGRPQRGAGR